ncbi:uncharacterized protein LOC135563054 [Oncorhynchus nerka]|uniref:uncharacterized protein LOC135563054 n=1 Tax=Oncorhynchus nerka TaxID=8023 RepID=UPI0031B7F7A1
MDGAVVEPNMDGAVVEPNMDGAVVEPNMDGAVLEPNMDGAVVEFNSLSVGHGLLLSPAQDCEEVGEERPWPLQGGERPWPLQGGERPCPLQGAERPWPLQGGERPCPLKTASVDSSWRSSQLSHVNYYGGYLGGAQQVRTLKQGSTDTKKDNTSSDPSFSRLHLPPLFSGSVVSLDQDSSRRKPRSPGGLGGKFLPLIHEAYVSSEDPAQTHPERLTQTYPVLPAHTILEPQAHPERNHLEKPGPRRLLLSVLLPLGHTEEEGVQAPCAGVHYKPSEEERGEPHCGETGHKRESTRRGEGEGRGGGGVGGGGRGLPEKGSKQTWPEQNGLSLLQPGEGILITKMKGSKQIWPEQNGLSLLQPGEGIHWAEGIIHRKPV